MLDVRRGWLLILAFLIQLVTIPVIDDPSALNLKRAVLSATALMLLWGILPNLRWWTFRVVAVGFVLNTAAMAANGGLMPVTPENYQKVRPTKAHELRLGQTPPHSKDVLLDRADTKLRFLSDTFYLASPTPRVYSVGDFFLMASALIFVVEVTARAGRARRRANKPIWPWRGNSIGIRRSQHRPAH